MTLFGEAKRKYQREWMAKRKAKFYEGKSCTKCGSIINLELHHLDKNTKESHRIWSWSWKRILEEVEKCTILCFECHRGVDGIHSLEKIKTEFHGKGLGYQKYKCRCDLCREWKRLSDKKYNQPDWRNWLIRAALKTPWI